MQGVDLYDLLSSRGILFRTVVRLRGGPTCRNDFWSVRSPDSVSATLDFMFVDLDLDDVNDPNGFFESMSLAYWDETGDGTNLTSIGTVYHTTADLAAEGSVTSSGKNDPIEWSLDLGPGGLNLLSLLNNADDGFWIQLGFGSEFTRDGSNTPAYLTAELNVSPVPVPAAI